jgi:hypothetical protein
MPKEITVGHTMTDEGGGNAIQGLVQVGWYDHGLVQISTFSRDPETFETKDSGYHVDLDRRQINEIIRHLRKARDRAFGRDE